jgi:pimeloyl-ACP methyl ester carboxylesterase
MPLLARVPGAAMTGSVFYLHGFASSARSTKADYFAERLAPYGVKLRRPDFNDPDFRSLTMTRMLRQLSDELSEERPGTVTLIGSSLGGALAILGASTFASRVSRLVLLAPAVMFAKPGHQLLPPERIEEWRRRGSLPFFHYGHGREEPLDYAFYEDTVTYDAFDAVVTQPTLIFQGLRDQAVDYRTVEAFAGARPNVTLSLLDDDHQLTASLPRMWDAMPAFLGLID